VALNGATFRPDNDDNGRYGDVPSPASAQPLYQELNGYAGRN
jgi:hypothetical protein